MTDTVSYISSSCNATVCAAHWGKNNLICYASCNAVLIYNPKVKFLKYQAVWELEQFFLVDWWWKSYKNFM